MALAAAAVMRPEHAGRGRPPRKSTFSKPFLVFFEPSRPQKWIRLEILHQKMVSGGPEVEI